MKRLASHRSKLWFGIALMGLGLPFLGIETGLAQTPAIASLDEESPFLRPPSPCPTDLEVLITGLLRDLPGYANRVARRSLGIPEDNTGFGTVLLAGRAEFEPLDISPLTFDGGPTLTAEDVQQVFFTTLERRYTATDDVTLEQYHWLFLTLAEDGWRLALMFTRTAPDEATIRPPTPPRENSDGIIGQAVHLWLRDCRAGAVYPIDPADSEIMGR